MRLIHRDVAVVAAVKKALLTACVLVYKGAPGHMYIRGAATAYLCTSLGLADHEAVYSATPRFPLVSLRHCTMSVMLSAHSRPRAALATPVLALAETETGRATPCMHQQW